MFQYGGLFEAPAQALAWLLPYEDVATRHVLTSLMAALGVAATWKLASHVAGPRAGFFAALLLVLTPAWTGHGFFNSKDIPFGAAAAWALYATLRIATGPRPVPWRSVVFAGLMTGAALGVRAGGMFLLAYPAIALVARSWLDRRLGAPAADGCESLPAADADKPATPGSKWRAIACIAAFVGIAWSVMLIAWPWAQVDPLRRPFEAVWNATHFGWGGNMLFRGAMVNAQAVPSDYLPTWFAITLPETYLVAAMCGIAFAVRWFRTRSTAERPTRLSGLALSLIAFAAVAPVVAAIGLRTILYDAHRHFLFVLPPLAAMGGCAIAAYLGSARVMLVQRLVVGALIFLACGSTGREMLALHPYEYVYFNRFEGGLAGASSQFETDYWGASYHEGLAWVVQNVQPTNGKRVRVASCECFYETRHYIEEIAHASSKFEVVKDGGAADIFLVGSRKGCPSFAGRILHIVQREGVPLLEVIRRDRG